MDLDVKIHSVVFLPQMPVKELGAFPWTGNFNSADFTRRLAIYLDNPFCVFRVSEMLPHGLQDILRWAKVQRWARISSLSWRLVIVIIIAQLEKEK